MSLTARGVSFGYPAATALALDDVSIDVEPGEVVLVAGPSGCGKSTLALVLAGLIPHRITGEFAGDVRLDGEPLAGLALHEVAARVGIVFQDPATQLVTPTVESEVAFGPENLALPRAEIEARVARALTLTRTAHLRHALTTNLSGGEKQRVAIAATLAMRPRYLVLDEPCSDLDPLGTAEILGVLRALAHDEGLGVLLVEHRVDEVFPWVNRIVLIDAGRVAVDEAAATAFTDPGPFDRCGVAVPEVVQLAHRYPAPFAGALPRSVDDAAAALAGTFVAAALRAPAPPPPPSLFQAAAPAVEWDGVGLAYGQRAVLRDVTLQVAPGEWLAIIGSNGSGKTSLVDLPIGFRAPTAGSVRVLGDPVVPGHVSTQARRIGYLFQAADTMLFTTSVRKELEFSLRQRRGRRAVLSGEEQQRVADLLRVAGLANREDWEPFQLSAGQRERLAIAALLTAAPSILILDEPTTGQDEAHARAIMAFLAELRRERAMTYLMITHDMRTVARHATTTAVLHEGRILTQGTPAEVFAHPDLGLAHIVPPPMAALHKALVPAARSVCLTVADVAARTAKARS